MEPIAAVYDTSVLFSAIYGYRRGRDTSPVRCLDAVLAGSVELCTSPVILSELLDALSRKTHIPFELIAESVELVRSASRLIETPGRTRVLQRDPADNAVLECALLSGAAYLVTGNREEFAELRPEPGEEIVYQRVRIVSPRDFLLELEKLTGRG